MYQIQENGISVIDGKRQVPQLPPVLFVTDHFFREMMEIRARCKEYGHM